MSHRLPIQHIAALTLGAALLGACGGGGKELPSASYGDGSVAPSEEYTIGPLDEITIHVWRNPELSADKVRVRPDGRLTIPLVQDIPAVGKTATELQNYIAGELSKYIEQPIVSVIVNTPEGNFTQQVRIIGATPQPADREKGTQTEYRLRLADLIRKGDASANVMLKPGDTIIIPESRF